MLSSCYLFILVAVAALTLQGRLSESAPAFSTSSHHRQRPSTAEQTFVRGMMAADHQFGLYMTLSETSRGGDSTVDDAEQRMNPATQACEEAMIRARKAAFRFGNGIIRQAKRMNDHSQ